MSLAQLRKNGRAGFTLPEILVAVAMVGVLSAVVLPTVIGQISKGEISRVVQDLQSIEQGTQMFRNDVGKYPASVAHLVTFTVAENGDPALSGTGNYATNAATLWQGPYLARGDVGSGLVTSGGTISLTLQNLDWDGDDAASSNFVVIAVTGLTTQRKELIDLAVDGIAGEGLNDAADGKIRYDGTTLYYFTSPVS